MAYRFVSQRFYKSLPAIGMSCRHCGVCHRLTTRGGRWRLLALRSTVEPNELIEVEYGQPLLINCKNPPHAMCNHRVRIVQVACVCVCVFRFFCGAAWKLRKWFCIYFFVKFSYPNPNLQIAISRESERSGQQYRFRCAQLKDHVPWRSTGYATSKRCPQRYWLTLVELIYQQRIGVASFPQCC